MSLEGIEDIYPLSATQAGMVYHALAQPHAGVYTGQVCFLLKGKVDPALMRETWNRVVDRHAVLRSAILWDELDEPLQVVHRDVEVPWQQLDWSGMSPDEQSRAMEQWKLEDREAGFDLVKPPLMRLTFIDLGGAYSWLVWTSHHAIADGWSVSALLNDMAAYYSGLAGGEELKLEPAFAYNQFIAWLQAQDEERAEAYWRRRLDGFGEATSLLTARPEHFRADTDTHDVELAALSAEDSAALVEASKAAKVSLFTLVQAAWGLLLSRYSQRDDVVFGVTSAGRPAELGGIERAVGLFLNTLPVRHTIDPGLSVAEWLQRLQAEALEFLSFEATPLPRVRAWSGITDGSPLFDSILVMTNYPKEYAPDYRGLDWSVDKVDVIDHSNYAIALVITGGTRVELKLVYDGNVISSQTAAQILRDLQDLLGTLAHQPQLPVGSIELPSGEARERLLGEWAAGPALAPQTGTVLDEWHARVREQPDHPAMVFAEEARDYAQLDRAASALAARMEAAGIEIGDRVAICLETGPAVIESILAVLKTGAAYVPLDPSLPLRRLKSMVEDSGARLVIAHSSQQIALEEVGTPLLCVDRQGSVQAADKAAVMIDDLAYVLFTSGSTGRPKGVAVTHANLACSTRARQAYYRDLPKRFLLLSACFFDSSVAGIFWTLTAGGTLVLPEKRIEQDMDRLASLVETNSVTHTLCLPGLYQAILMLAPAHKLRCLETVILAGEALPAEAIRQHRDVLPAARLYNEYGPTEGTVWCTVYDTIDWNGEGAVPIGRPIPGADIYILDAQKRLVPPGVSGEICIAGKGVAAGYLGLPEATAERFIADPVRGGSERMYCTGDLGRYLPDGVIEFIGRQDEQVKIRGYRIELAEIEAALLEHPAVNNAIVLAVADSASGRQRQQLLAYLETADQAMLPATCKAYLRDQLPEHMVPHRYIVMEAFPHLPNGKVDREALRALPLEDQVEEAAPDQALDDELAGKLKTIWAGVLKRDAVGAHDNFFELGGDSLLSINVVSRARQQDIELQPSHLFDFPTIAELCAHLAEEAEYQPQGLTGGEVRSRNIEGSRKPFFMVHGGRRILSELRNALGDDQPLHVQPAHWDSGDIDRDATIGDLVAEALENLRKLQPLGPYLLGGYSFGAVIALEMARRLEQDGQQVRMLFMLDPPEKPSSYRSVAGKGAQASQAQQRVKRPLRSTLVYYRERAPDNINYWLAKACRALHIPESDKLKAARHKMHVAKTYIGICADYDLQPIESPLVVFRATEGYHKADTSIWQAIANGGLVLEQFDCGHEDLQWDVEMVRHWAQLFKQYVDQAV